MTGRRYSQQRELIYDAVHGSVAHPSAEMVYQQLKPLMPKLSLGTVYRNLNSLVDMGSNRRVGVPGKADRFDRTLEQHNHLYCRECGRVEDVTLDESALNSLLVGSADFELEGYSLTLYGLCPHCRKMTQS